MPRPRAKIDLGRLAEAFSPDGLHGTTSDALADALGISKPTLYAHFGSKPELFRLAVEGEVERVLGVLGAVEARTAGHTARHRATGVVEALLRHAAGRPAGMRLLHRTAFHRDSPVADRVEASVGRIPRTLTASLGRDLAADGLDTGLAGWIACTLWASIPALAERREAEGRIARGELAAMVATMIPAPRHVEPETWW